MLKSAHICSSAVSLSIRSALTAVPCLHQQLRYASAAAAHHGGSGRGSGSGRGRSSPAPRAFAKKLTNSKTHSKGNSHVKRERERERKPHEFGDTLRHGFGEFNGLTNIDKLKDIKRDSHKQDTFMDFKILQPVREFFMKEIANYSILYQHKLNKQLAGAKSKSKSGGSSGGSSGSGSGSSDGGGIRSADDYISQVKPTEIQKLAMKEILKPRHKLNPLELRIFSIAGETGCGKTYSYLIPLVNNLKNDQLAAQQQEANEDEGSKRSKPTTINSVILLPTNELIEQLYSTVQNLPDGLGLSVAKLNYETSIEQLVDQKRRVDLLITTPGKFNLIKKFYSLVHQRTLTRHIKYCIIDEADTLLDRSFLKDTMETVRAMPMVKDLVIISSTVSKGFNQNLNKLFHKNEVIKICSKKLHRISNKTEFRVIDCNMRPFRNSKMAALKQCLYSIYCDNTEDYEAFKKVVVFVNEKETVAKVWDVLSMDKSFQGYELYKISGGDLVEERLKLMRGFNEVGRPAAGSHQPLEESAGDAEPANEKKKEKKKMMNIPQSNITIDVPSDSDSDSTQRLAANTGDKKPKLKILITTDILSRGINFQQTANVVLFDVPKTSADLLNRSGRVSRIGMQGRVFLLVAKNEMKSWVAGLPSVVRNGLPLA